MRLTQDNNRSNPSLLGFRQVYPRGRRRCFHRKLPHENIGLPRIQRRYRISVSIASVIALAEYQSRLLTYVVCRIDGGGGATFAAIPSYFRSNGYQEPADGEHCVFQQALNTDLPVQEWLRSHPEFAEYYDRHLDGYYESVNPFESYSLHELAANTQSDRAFFIGIGDATGKQSRKVKSLVPAARVVLQATSRQLEGLQNTDQGIELCPQDYLQEQKIKGESPQQFDELRAWISY